MRPVDRKVQPGSLGSIGCTLRVVGFIRSLWGHGDTPWVSLGSSGIARFTMVRHGVFRVDQALVGSLGCTLDVVLDSWVHCGAPWESSGSFGVI